eukprot:SM000047S16836  [mRNA]  locus=s47:254506:255989:+ [translate_table: standard]
MSRRTPKLTSSVMSRSGPSRRASMIATPQDSAGKRPRVSAASTAPMGCCVVTRNFRRFTAASVHAAMCAGVSALPRSYMFTTRIISVISWLHCSAAVAPINTWQYKLKAIYSARIGGGACTIVEERGVSEAGADKRHEDAMREELHAQALRQATLRVLGGRMKRRQARCSHQAGQRAHENDGTAKDTATPLHQRKHSLDGIDRSQQVKVLAPGRTTPALQMRMSTGRRSNMRLMAADTTA